PATVTKSPAPSPILMSRSLPFWAAIGSVLVCERNSRRLGHGTEAHNRAVGAAVRFAPHVGERGTQIDEPVPGKRKRRVIERLHQRARDEVRLAMPALARPHMQRELVLLARLFARGVIDDPRLSKRDIGEGR